MMVFKKLNDLQENANRQLNEIRKMRYEQNDVINKEKNYYEELNRNSGPEEYSDWIKNIY